MENLEENPRNWTSGNREIDDIIREIQLEFNNPSEFIWVPYNQFSNFKEFGNGDGNFAVATWKHNQSDVTVNLKYLDNSQNITAHELREEVRRYSIGRFDIIFGNICEIYGISQNPVAKDYILVLQDVYCEGCDEKYTEIRNKWCNPCQIKNLRKNFKNWTSGNEIIDEFIQEMQLKINRPYDTIFEWISYNQFSDIKRIGNTIYSGLWNDGQLEYIPDKKEWIRVQAKQVILKLCNSHKMIDVFLNKVKAYYKISQIYGISQESITKDYIMVLQEKYDDEKYCEKCIENYTDIEYKWCKQCQMDYLKKIFTSGNEKIDEFIQEMQLKINNPKDIIFEWIPYNQFIDIKERYKTVYSASWKDGPLEYDFNNKMLERVQAREVTLKLCNSQNMINDFLNKVKVYVKIFNVYGITQYPDSKDYVMVLQQKEYVKSYCETCIEEYTDMKHKWCKPCQIDYLKKNFTNWSGNEKIDEFIQEIQLKINNPNDMLFEWISFNQFKNIKKIGEGGFAKVYSAEWKNGPLHYDKEWKRSSCKKVALKCLNKSQNKTEEFLNEIKAYSMNKYGSNIIRIYGISQDPKTKNYIIVLQYAKGGNFNDWINKCYKDFDWNNKLRTLHNIIFGLNEIHQKQMVHCDFHTGNILFEYGYVNQYNDTYISDMGLCGEIGNVDKSKIYGVMSYVAPEVLRGKPYTKAADIYSFGMIMYFVATGRQPFSVRAHDKLLALDICNGIRPKLNELEAPKCYVELMERCWDSAPDNRPNAIEVENIIYSYYFSSNDEIKKQFKEAEEYRKINISFIEIHQSTIHPQARNISRLLNPFTKDLP